MGDLIFYPGLHQPSDAKHFGRACISINRLWSRRKRVGGSRTRLFVDSGAFTEISTHGRYRAEPETYAARLVELHHLGIATIDVAASQDYMCEPFILAKTGLTLADHQRLTIERYDRLVLLLTTTFAPDPVPFVILPVLQGWDVADYVEHLRAYGDRIRPGAWVGVGSVCKRQASPETIRTILRAIKAERPDIHLHGFGVKSTSLQDPVIRELLSTADSMAWSLAARRQGRDANDWKEAQKFARRMRLPT